RGSADPRGRVASDTSRWNGAIRFGRGTCLGNASTNPTTEIGRRKETSRMNEAPFEGGQPHHAPTAEKENRAAMHWMHNRRNAHNRIAREVLDKIRQHTLEIVGNFVTLKPSGSAAKGLCPFHDDHTPSLSVRRESFKCFACGVAGDVFEFVMR